MKPTTDIIYKDNLADSFRLVVDCINMDDHVSYYWRIEILEVDGQIFGVVSDGEPYDTKTAAEVSGRFYYLANYAS
jgi:hypothetical protein